MIEGYFLVAQKESEEHCNCGSSTEVDVHAWIVDNRPTSTKPKDLKAMRPKSVNAEISPRIHGKNHRQRMKFIHTIVNWIARNRLKIRVYGWITWDQEHPSHMRDGIRGSLWEIHPTHKVEVLTPNHGWKDLDGLLDADLIVD